MGVSINRFTPSPTPPIKGGDAPFCPAVLVFLGYRRRGLGLRAKMVFKGEIHHRTDQQPHSGTGPHRAAPQFDVVGGDQHRPHDAGDAPLQIVLAHGKGQIDAEITLDQQGQGKADVLGRQDELNNRVDGQSQCSCPRKSTWRRPNRMVPLGLSHF